MIDRLAELEARYDEIGRQLATQEVASDPRSLADLGRPARMPEVDQFDDFSPPSMNW